MKIELGQYVRTKNGIGKIDQTEMFMGQYFQFHLDSNKGSIHNVTTNTYWNTIEDVIGEPSNDLLDVLQEGDYVNGEKVIKHFTTWLASGTMVIKENDVKTVVTKEQFESMEYVLGEEK